MKECRRLTKGERGGESAPQSACGAAERKPREGAWSVEDPAVGTEQKAARVSSAAGSVQGTVWQCWGAGETHPGTDGMKQVLED